MSAPVPRPARPRLVDPALAARVPGLRRAAGVALLLGVVSAVVVVVLALALAHVIARSLLDRAPLGSLLPGLVLVGVALVARAAVHAVGNLAANGTADGVVASLRGNLLRHALVLGPGWLSGERPGELSLTATRGLRALHVYYGQYLPQAAAAAVVPALLLAWVATRDWLSLVVVIALVAAVPLTMVYFGREATRRSERQWRRLGSLAGHFLGLVEGLPTLRAFGREGQGRREVAAATEGVRTATVRTLRVAFLSALAMDMIAGFGVGLVAMVVGLRLLWGQLDLQTGMAVLLVAPEIFVPLRRAGAEFHASTEGQAAAARILGVLETPGPATPAVAPAVAPVVAPAVTTPSVAPRAASGTALDVDELTVAYPHRELPALRSVTFHVPAGTRVALTGPSGSGKSTVVATLLRFVEPEAGNLRVGARRAAEEPPEIWRRHFSWLPQRPHLFQTSIAQNLRLGSPRATEAELHRLLAAVGLDELVEALPDGLDTALGHDGLTLSAGERQRLGLARALLRPAPILLLDEPTASLDPPTVAKLAPAIEPWLTDRTVVVASHAPTLLAHFDAVVVLPLTTLPVAAAP